MNHVGFRVSPLGMAAEHRFDPIRWWWWWLGGAWLTWEVARLHFTDGWTQRRLPVERGLGERFPTFSELGGVRQKFCFSRKDDYWRLLWKNF